MAIRTWSFTKFWSVSAILWLLAAALAKVGRWYDIADLPAVLLAFLPAFLAGSWAGHHHEIAAWPRMRLVSMWVMVIGSALVLNEARSWYLPVILIGAPAVVFTLRWFELQSGPRIEAPHVPPTVPPGTPPGGSLI